MINDFLIDFYSEKTNEDISQDKIDNILNTYGNNVDSLIVDLYDKYDSGNINENKIGLIKETYGLSSGDSNDVETKVETEPVVDNAELIKKKEYEFSKGMFKMAEREAYDKYKETGEIDISLLPKESNDPNIIQDYLSGPLKMTASLFKGVGDYKSMGNMLLMDAGLRIFSDVNDKQRQALVAAEGEKGQMQNFAWDKIEKSLDKYQQKYENESFLDDWEQGNKGLAVKRAVGAAIESIPTTLAAFTGLGGIIALGGSLAGSKFKEEYAKDSDRNIYRLAGNALLSGATESAFEGVTRYLGGKVGLIAVKNGGQAAKEFTKTSIERLLTNFGLAPIGEGASEAATRITTDIIDKITLGDGFDWKNPSTWVENWSKTFKGALEEGIIGGISGGGFGTVAQFKNSTQEVKEAAALRLMSQSDKADIGVSIKKINEAASKLENANETETSLLEEIINEESSNINDIKRNSYNKLNNLSEKDLGEYAKNSDKIQDEISKIRKGDVTEELALEKANKNIKNLTDANTNLINEAERVERERKIKFIEEQGDLVLKASDQTRIDRAIREIESETGLEVDKSQIETNPENFKIEIINENNVDEILDKYSEDKTLFSKKDLLEEVEGTYLANKGVILMSEDAALGVLEHEGVHNYFDIALNKLGNEDAVFGIAKVMMDKMKSIDADAAAFVDRVTKRYESDPRYKAKDVAEEVLTFYAQVKKQYNRFDKKDLSSSKLATSIRRLFQNSFNLSNVELTEDNVMRFIDDYLVAIEKGSLTKFQERFAKGEVEISESLKEKGRKIGREKRVEDLKKEAVKETGEEVASEEPIVFSKKLTPEETTKVEQDISDLKQEIKENEEVAKKYDKEPIPTAKQQRLEASIKEQIKPTVDAFVESQTKRLFDPITVEARNNVGRNEFRTSMASDIQTMVLNEFDATKQGVEKFITNRGYLRANSLAKRLGIESKEVGVKKDVTEQKGLTTSETIDEFSTSEVKLPTRSTFRRKINRSRGRKGLTQEEVDSFKKIATEISKTLPPVEDKKFRNKVDQLSGPKLKKFVKDNIFKGEKYNEFIKNNYDLIKDLDLKYLIELDKGLMKQGKERAFTKPVRRLTSQEDIRKYKDSNKVYVENEAQGVMLYDILDPGADFVVDFYTNQTPQNVSNRKGKLAEAFGKKMFKDALPEIKVKQEAPIQERAKAAEKIQRDPGLKFSVTNKKVSEQYQNVAQAKDINKAMSSIDVENVTITNKNRAQKLINNLNFIIKGKIGSATFELAKLGNFGRDYEYGKITNGSFVKKSKLLGGKKYFKTIDGDYILSTNKKASLKYDGKDKITNWQPSRGSLFYGKTDPNYIKALEEAIKNDSEPINKKLKELKVKKVTVKDRITSSFIEANKSQSDANMNALELMSLNLQEAVHKYNMPIEDAALFLTSGYQATSGILKIAAPFKYVSKVFEYATIGKSNQKTGKKFREEHNPPASVVGASIILAIKNNQVKEVFPFIKNNYYQTQLSKADDALLDIANLDSTLPEGTSILDNPIKRLAAAGINLNTIINPLTNKNIAEENGFGITKGFENMPDLYTDQNKAILSGENIDKKVLKNNTKFSKSRENSRVNNIENVKSSEVVLTEDNMTNEDVINKAATLDEALAIARDPNAPVKKIRVFDFDDTLAQTKSIVFYTKADGTEGKLTAEEFAEKGADLVAEGAVMDFSDFNIVRDGKRGPLFDIAKKIEKARGTEDVFVLTARAPESQQAIHEFLKSEGLNIPIENITGLGNSTGAAKADWIVNKAADGYNDFYFADDAYQNVKAVQDALSQLDVKSKVQQAKVKFSKTVNEDFNKIIEQKTGIASEKVYSKAKAKVRGAGKGNKKFFIPYSAEDFMGLIYPLLSKGALGDSQMAWFKQNLLDPYARAVENLSTDRLQLMEDFKALKKALEVPKNLRKQNDTGFTNEQAVRVYLFNKMGYDTPGLSKTDLQDLIDIVNSDGLLKAFADQLMNLTKGDGYAKPGQSWLAGTITTDLIDVLNTVKRKKYLEQSGFLENADLIFSEENLNKLEAAYGEKYRESMENILKRMKSGKNRLFSGNRLSNRVLDYVNGSIGTIMFLNARSAVLQTISSINFINWSFNNPIKAGKAFANQKQYWKDFMDLMNSDYLMDRRNGLKLNISESEIADAASTSKNKAKAAINYILQKGFAPTQIADSFAIASGGATFYRNRINDLIKNEGLTEAEAKEKAMLEFRQIAETSQQSSDPSKISAQQSSDLGRIILAFANTPMQYARIQKRAAQDLINGRGDAKTHVSKIIYYGVVQNIIFNALQQSLFALGFGDDEDDLTGEKLEAYEKEKRNRYYKIANGMLDSQLRGLGVAGATAGVIKNFLLDIYERSGRKRPEYVDAVYKLLQISPPISSKISKVRQAAYQFDSKKRREEVFEKGFSIDNPAYEAGAKVISATTNIPLDRVFNKVNNIEAALAEDTETWQTVAMLAGWPEWQIKPDKKPSELSDKEKAIRKVDKQKENYKAAKGSSDFDTLKKLNKEQQIKMLKSLGYGEYKIRKAKTEADRIRLIQLKNVKNK